VFKGKGTAARDILIGKPGQRNPFGKGQLGPYERFARAGKGATRVGAVVSLGALGLVVKDLLSGLNDEEKAEMLAKLEGLTEEQMVALAKEQERLKKVKKKKDRSRALSRFVDLMYERPTTIGDLGIMYQQERLGTVPAETVAAKEIEEMARMSGLPVETVMMMQYPQGALFAQQATSKRQQIANAIVNYLIEQGVLDEVTAVERRATLLELPEESLEKIARELGVPLGDLAPPGATVLEPD
jgi:site-specific DNA-cytosine methylase